MSMRYIILIVSLLSMTAAHASFDTDSMSPIQ
jgi:hypothetical protein